MSDSDSRRAGAKAAPSRRPVDEAKRSDSRRESRTLGMTAMALLLATPFTIFVRNADYPLLAPETFLCTTALVALGLVLGSIRATPFRIFAIATATTLFIDCQTRLFTHWDLGLIGAFATMVVVASVLRRIVAGLACVVCGTLLLTSLVFSVGSRSEQPVADAASPARPDLPPIVHIILDEQIGPEGLPQDIDPTRAHADALKRFYLDRGFQLFGNAFAISTSSVLSIANALNFNTAEPRKDFAYGPMHRKSLSRNAYFRVMARRGYRIHVYQSDYVNYCKPEDARGANATASAAVRRSKGWNIASCATYELETIGSIRHANLAASEKAKVIANMYVRLSFVLTDLRTRYQKLQGSLAASGLPLPAWKVAGRVSPASVMPVMQTLRSELARAEPGSLYFAHLMLPHFPYAFDRSCNLRPRVAEWLINFDIDYLPLANSEESRALRYEQYLEQVACTHQKLAEIFDAMARGGRFEQTRIIVHGDHGSRILRAPMDVHMEEEIRPLDYLDAYSTLFAVKDAGDATSDAASYDRRLLPIGALLAGLTLEGSLPEGSDWAPPATIYLSGARGTQHAARPMPDFAAGVPLSVAE